MRISERGLAGEAEGKTHTIRGPRRRHARIGEEVQLYEGMRTKRCRLIGRGECNRVRGIELCFGRRPFVRLYEAVEIAPGEYRPGGEPEPVLDLEAFARSDGFAGGFEAMEGFWFTHHKGVRVFDGFLIGWRPPAATAARTSTERLGCDEPPLSREA